MAQVGSSTSCLCFFVYIFIKGDIMRNIVASAKIHDNNKLKVVLCFKGYSAHTVVAINIKIINCNENPFLAVVNKMICVTDEDAIWCDSIKIDEKLVVEKIIVEVHCAGELLYIQDLPINCPKIEEKVYVLNADIRWRYENESTISVFNTNGNLLFLKGVYKDLWEDLLMPISEEKIVSGLLNKGYSQEKIKLAITSLLKRDLIIRENLTNIDYV